MIDRRIIFEIHRLANEGFSNRKIAETLGLSRKSTEKYLREPNPAKAVIRRGSKLDPFKEEIGRLLALDPKASAVVIAQRLRPLGFDGGLTILKQYLVGVREGSKKKTAFIRFESEPGRQCQIDWGHCGALDYGTTRRKVYVLAVIECHARLLYLEFTHSQKQEALHRGLLNAFRFFGGTPGELVSDNMLTAVLERDGPLIRFNGAYLEFLRPFKISPYACHLAAPWEKGKVEKGAIQFIKRNFWPLRAVKDLADLQTQADQWRDREANVRIHGTTGEPPIQRFQPTSMKPLPDFLPDPRETTPARVHSDFSIRFDANHYTVPPWAVGKQVILKADNQTLTVYYQDTVIATHRRCWERRRRIELPEHREEARRRKEQHWRSEEADAFISLGPEAKTFLERLAAAGLPIKKNLKKLLALKREYGSHALVQALQRAIPHQAYGAEYIENILYQEMTPQVKHPPLKLQKEDLNHIRLEEPSLAEYDAFVVKRRNDHD